MSSVSTHDLHVPKGPNLFALSVGASVCFAMALVFFAFGWLGGEEFMANLGGNLSLGVLVLGLVASTVMAFVERPAKYRGDERRNDDRRH